MFKSRTLFVLGAGASKEAGLPIGSELTSQIAKLVDLHTEYGAKLIRGDYSILQALTGLTSDNHQWRDNKFLASGSEMAEAMELAPSIDTFLQTHANNREYVLLGKLGIVKAISNAERQSRLGAPKDRSQRLPISRLADTWYVRLAQQLFSGIPAEKPELAFENVRFISFNYDRCLQIFLVRALEVYFRLSTEDAQRIVKDVPILYPYGWLGSPFEGDKDHLAFGAEHINLLAAVERIRTFSESVESDNMKQAVRREMDEAQNIVFLGFGFLPQNMDLLDSGLSLVGGKRFTPRVFATTLGLSDSDEGIIADQLIGMLEGEQDGLQEEMRIDTFQATCTDLFARFWRSITA